MGGEDGVATERHQYQLQDATSDRGFRRPARPVRAGCSAARREADRRRPASRVCRARSTQPGSSTVSAPTSFCVRTRRPAGFGVGVFDQLENGPRSNSGLWCRRVTSSLVRPPTGGPLSRPHPRGDLSLASASIVMGQSLLELVRRKLEYQPSVLRPWRSEGGVTALPMWSLPWRGKCSAATRCSFRASARPLTLEVRLQVIGYCGSTALPSRGTALHSSTCSITVSLSAKSRLGVR